MRSGVGKDRKIYERERESFIGHLSKHYAPPLINTL